MQTIKVTIKTEDDITGFYAACKRPFAHVSPDFYHKGRFAGYYGAWASCDNKTFADAIEFIGNEIERLNYTLVVISTKEVKSVCAGLWFDDKTAAERYAEGVTAGLALAGKKNCAVIMHLTDDPDDQKALISKNLTFRHTDIYFRDYRNLTPAISTNYFGAKAAI